MFDEEECYVRGLYIDPSSNACGVSVLDINVLLGTIRIVHRRTILPRYRLSREAMRAENIGDFAVKLEQIHDEIYEVCQIYRPNRARHETPYMGDLPQTFGRLTQVNTAITIAIRRYSESIPIESINPATVKKNLGVPGNSGNKELMRAAVIAVPYLINDTEVDLSKFTEHEIDGTAIGIYDANESLGIPRLVR